jgi:hypothetical protein
MTKDHDIEINDAVEFNWLLIEAVKTGKIGLYENLTSEKLINVLAELKLKKEKERKERKGVKS